MSLPEEARKQLDSVYGDLSEELYIFFRCLKYEGFSSEEAITILCAIIGRPDGFISNYKQKRSKSEQMATVRKYINDRKMALEQSEQNENILKQVGKKEGETPS